MALPRLELQKITKGFAGKILFQDLSLAFTPGCYVILGQNGMGKSTLLGMMSGSIPCDAGNIIVNDIDLVKHPVAAKKQLSYVPDKTMMYPFVKGKEFLSFIAAIKKTTPTVDAKMLINEFGLDTYMEIPFSKMSLGTQKKFMIVAAIIGNPAILIMDEPTNGLDTASREALINYLLQYVQQKIMIVATHEQELIEKLHAKKLRFGKHPISHFQEELLAYDASSANYVLGREIVVEDHLRGR